MSIIKLFRNCKILEEKNFQVDDIEQYLATLTPVKTFDNAQYIKMGLDAEVKVNLDQTYLDKQWTNMYNYCSIEMDNGGNDNTYYYFIRKMQWISKDAIKLILHLDVLNTYQGAYKLTDKTTINRMHKDRWEKIEQLSNLSYKQYDFNITGGWIQHSYQDASLNYHITYSSLNINVIAGYELFQTNFVEYPHFQGDYVCTINYYPTEALKITQFIKKSQITTNYDSLTGRYYFEIDINTKSTTSPDLTKWKYPTAVKGNIILKPVGDATAKYLQGKVDSTTEDFGDLSKILRTSETLYELGNNPTANRKWYLLYRTPDNVTSTSTVECLVVPNFNFKIGVGSGSTSYSKSSFDRSYTYYILKNDNPSNTTISSGANSYDLTSENVGYAITRTQDDDGYIKVWRLHYSNNKERIISEATAITAASSITITNGILMRRYNDTTVLDADTYNVVNNSIEIDIPQSGSSIYARKINTFDRSDTRNIKIIELPYAPINFDEDTSKYVVDLAEGTIRLVTGYNNEVPELENNPLNIDLANYVNLNQLAIYDDMKTTDRFLKDPKLLHSSITEIKCCYDNYSKTFSLEDCRLYDPVIAEYPTEYLVAVFYKQANTVTSSLAFKFEPAFIEEGDSDYYPYIVSTRNNDIQLYNNEYVNYMRTDYNYAKKAQQLQTVNNIVNTTVAGVGGAIAGAKTGGVPGAVIGGITGAAKGVQNTITSYISSSNAIEQTKLNKKLAATGVSGSDDLNLFNYYGENKLQVKVYQPKDYIMEKIDDLFYYCGYKCFDQAVPNTTSRYWFNFIQCDPIFDCDNTTAKMSKDQLDELTSKLQQGITVLHHHSTWDFDQVKENWEIGLVY